MQNQTPADPLVGLPARRSSVSRFIRLGFWTLGVLTLVNLNHFFNMTVGTGWPITLGVAFCCALLCLLVRIPLRRNLGLPGLLIVATLVSYLFIGLSVALVTDVEWYLADITIPFRVGLAVLIVVATTFGASSELRRLGIESLLKRILIILAVPCIFILATPFLFEYVYTMPSHLSDVLGIARNRFIGTYTGPNLSGGVACYTAGLALVFLNGNRYRGLAASVLILSSMAVMVTFSRTAFLTLAGLLLFFGFLSIASFRSRRGGVVALTIALIGGGCTLFVFTAEYFFVEEAAGASARLAWIRTLGAEHRDLLDTRMALSSIGWSQIIESPLFGRGLWQFHHLEGAPRCRRGVMCGVHNSYLMLWGEAGIIPFLLFVFFTGLLLWKSLMLPRSLATNAIAALTFVFVTASLTVDGSLYFPWHTFILGLSCALAVYATRESRDRHPSGPRPVAERPPQQDDLAAHAPPHPRSHTT